MHNRVRTDSASLCDAEVDGAGWGQHPVCSCSVLRLLALTLNDVIVNIDCKIDKIYTHPGGRPLGMSVRDFSRLVMSGCLRLVPHAEMSAHDLHHFACVARHHGNRAHTSSQRLATVT